MSHPLNSIRKHTHGARCNSRNATIFKRCCNTTSPKSQAAAVSAALRTRVQPGCDVEDVQLEYAYSSGPYDDDGTALLSEEPCISECVVPAVLAAAPISEYSPPAECSPPPPSAQTPHVNGTLVRPRDDKLPTQTPHTLTYSFDELAGASIPLPSVRSTDSIISSSKLHNDPSLPASTGPAAPQASSSPPSRTSKTFSFLESITAGSSSTAQDTLHSSQLSRAPRDSTRRLCYLTRKIQSCSTVASLYDVVLRHEQELNIAHIATVYSRLVQVLLAPLQPEPHNSTQSAPSIPTDPQIRNAPPTSRPSSLPSTSPTSSPPSTSAPVYLSSRIPRLCMKRKRCDPTLLRLLQHCAYTVEACAYMCDTTTSLIILNAINSLSQYMRAAYTHRPTPPTQVVDCILLNADFSTLSPSELAWIMTAVANIQNSPPHTYHIISTHTTSPPQPPPVPPLPAPSLWHAHYLTATMARMRNFTPSQLTSLIIGVAMLPNPPPPEWLAAWYSATASALIHMTDPQLSCVLDALPHFPDKPPANWMFTLESALAPRLAHLHPLTMTAVLETMIVLQYRPDSRWLGRLEEGSTPVLAQLTPRMLVRLLAALVTMTPHLPMHWLREFYHVSMSALPTSTPGQLAALMLAVGLLDVPPPKAWVAKVLARLRVLAPRVQPRQAHKILVALEKFGDVDVFVWRNRLLPRKQTTPPLQQQGVTGSKQVQRKARSLTQQSSGITE